MSRTTFALTILAALACAGAAVAAGAQDIAPAKKSSASVQKARATPKTPAAQKPAAIAPPPAAAAAAAAPEADMRVKCLNADNALAHYLQVLACNTVIAANARDAAALVARGSAYAAVGEYDHAITDYNAALALNPEAANVYVNRGKAQWRLKKLDEAFADESRAIALDPAAAEAYAVRGAVLLEQDHFGKAREDLNYALKLQPTHVLGLEQRMLLAMRTGKAGPAIIDADALAALSPQDAYYQNLKCWTRVVARTELGLAREACDRAIEISGGAPNYLNSRGLLNLKERKYLAAFADYDSAAKKAETTEADALFGRGLAQRGLGKKEEARADMNAALVRDPAIADMFRRYGYAP